MISQHGTLIRLLAATAVIVAGISGCSSNKGAEQAPAARKPVVVAAPARRPSSVGERAAAVAMQQVGTPYRYGGSTPRGFDCSGLVHYAYSNAGKSIPRTTKSLWSSLAPVDGSRMRVGDLLFFSIEGKMSHVGLYLGKGRFVHAPSSGKVVTVESLESDFYRRAFIRAGRP